MSSNLAKGSDKVLSDKDKNVPISDTAFVHDTLREIYSIERFGSVKAAQNEAYAFLRKRVTKHFTMRRVRSLFEGTARRIDGEEKDAIRMAQIEEAKREQHELRGRLAKLDAALAGLNADFPGPQMAAHREAAFGLGRVDRPGTEG